MRVTLGDWVFDVDIGATMEYSAAEAAEHCDCAYCRNFYAAVDAAYPELGPALADFGVDIQAPEELMPYDLDDRMVYDGVWAVCGKVVKQGRGAVSFGGISILPDPENSLNVNCFCPEPYFLLNVSGLELSWGLDEPMCEVLSPANQSSFLSKMWDRLLGKRDGGPNS